jgi:hypothetical protein
MPGGGGATFAYKYGPEGKVMSAKSAKANSVLVLMSKPSILFQSRRCTLTGGFKIVYQARRT